MLISLVEYYDQIAQVEREDVEIERSEVAPAEIHHNLKAKRNNKRRIDRKMKRYERDGKHAENKYRREFRLYDKHTYIGDVWERKRRPAFKNEVFMSLRDYHDDLRVQKELRERVAMEEELCWDAYFYWHRSRCRELDYLYFNWKEVENEAWMWYACFVAPPVVIDDFDVEALPADEWDALKEFLCA